MSSSITSSIWSLIHGEVNTQNNRRLISAIAVSASLVILTLVVTLLVQFVLKINILNIVSEGKAGMNRKFHLILSNSLNMINSTT